jgi:hypothetical protein
MENNFESTLALPCLINSRVDMVDFVNLNKVVNRRNAFSEFFLKKEPREKKKIQKKI